MEFNTAMSMLIRRSHVNPGMHPRALVAGLVVLGLLAGCSSKSATYPDAYMLEADELPAGLKLSEVPPDWPIQNNPAEIPANFMGALGEEFRDFKPQSAWAEMIESTSSSSSEGPDGGLISAAGFWSDEAKAQKVIDELKSQSENQVCQHPEAGALLRDGNVIVIMAGDESMGSWVPKLIAAIQEDAPNLKNAC